MLPQKKTENYLQIRAILRSLGVFSGGLYWKKAKIRERERERERVEKNNDKMK